MRPAPTSPSVVSIQHDVRAHFGWTYEADRVSAAQLREACNHHPSAEAFGWSASGRAETMEVIRTALVQAQQVVLVGAGVEIEDMNQTWAEGTVFVAADGAVGACLGQDVVCVVTDLDGEPHLSRAVEQNIPLVVHAHGDNVNAWRHALQQWSAKGGIPLMLTHQCDEHHDDMYNVGGFTDGDRAACFIRSLGVPNERVRYMGYTTDRVGSWSGATNPERKLAKLVWMERVLDLLDPEWPSRQLPAPPTAERT